MNDTLHIDPVEKPAKVDYAAFNEWYRAEHGYYPSNRWMRRCGVIWRSTIRYDDDPDWTRAYIVAADGSDHCLTLPARFVEVTE